jgi:MFS family permease
MSRTIAGRAAAILSARTGGRRVTIAVYGTVSFLYWASLYLYVPTLPTYVEEKSELLAMVGVVLAQYGLWQAIIRFPLGIAGDWLGWHKPLLVVGLSLSGLGALTMATATSVTQLAIGRAITGLAAGTWVPLVVTFSGLFPTHEAVRAVALLTFIGSSGRVLATSVTGSLNELHGYTLAFYLAAGAAMLAVLIVLPAHSRRRPPQRPSREGIGRLVSRRDVLLPSLLAAVSQYANWASTFSFMPILARELGATDVTLSMLLSLHIGVVIAGNLATSTIVKRIRERTLAYASFLLLFLGLGLAALAPTLPVVFIAQFFLGVSQGFGYPVFMGLSIRFVSDNHRTTAMGLHQAVYAVGMFGGPWASGELADRIGIQPMFGMTAFACLILGLIGTRWLRSESRFPSSGA